MSEHTQDTLDRAAFQITDKLIAAGIVLRENRARAAAIVASEYDKRDGKIEHEELVDGYSSL